MNSHDKATQTKKIYTQGPVKGVPEFQLHTFSLVARLLRHLSLAVFA